MIWLYPKYKLIKEVAEIYKIEHNHKPSNCDEIPAWTKHLPFMLFQFGYNK